MVIRIMGVALALPGGCLTCPDGFFCGGNWVEAGRRGYQTVTCFRCQIRLIVFFSMFIFMQLFKRIILPLKNILDFQRVISLEPLPEDRVTLGHTPFYMTSYFPVFPACRSRSRQCHFLSQTVCHCPLRTALLSTPLTLIFSGNVGQSIFGPIVSSKTN